MTDKKENKLRWYEFIWCCWTVIAGVASGGLIGGAIGAGASALNVKIMEGKKSLMVKYFLTLIISITALVLFTLSASLIHDLLETK